jgi:diguanylate cyclase (GGDEF)-like protein
MLPETNAESASIIAERIRQMISDIVIDTVQGSLSFTISIGAAEIQNEEKIEGIQKRADEALYKAKEKGRNYVVFAS